MKNTDGRLVSPNPRDGAGTFEVGFGIPEIVRVGSAEAGGTGTAVAEAEAAGSVGTDTGAAGAYRAGARIPLAFSARGAVWRMADAAALPSDDAL